MPLMVILIAAVEIVMLEDTVITIVEWFREDEPLKMDKGVVVEESALLLESILEYCTGSVIKGLSSDEL